MHAHGRPDVRRPLALALAVVLGFAAVETAAGWAAGSLALLADAAHMLSDGLALGLALGAAWLARRPATPQRSFGWLRAEVLAALANALVLVLLGGGIVWEAAARLDEPPEVTGAVVLATGWAYADPLAGLLIGVLVVLSTGRILRETVGVLLEGAPAGMDARAVGAAIADVEGVVDVHDLHLWTITSGFPALSAHVLVAAGADCHAIRRELEGVLRERFALTHTTLQVEHAPGLIKLAR